VKRDDVEAIARIEEALPGVLATTQVCRWIVAHRDQLSIDESDPVMRAIRGFVSETDDFDVDEARRALWNPAALAAKDAELEAYLEASGGVREELAQLLSRLRTAIDETPETAPSHTFFVVEPEVAGGLGPHTVMDRSVHPPLVAHLHYVLDGWLGDQIVESFPCWIVTGVLADTIRRARLSGASFEPVEVSTSDEFDELYPGRSLPKFERIVVIGLAESDDFGIGVDQRLVVSSAALGLLQRLGAANMSVEAV
jgi:hypothetical protein